MNCEIRFRLVKVTVKKVGDAFLTQGKQASLNVA